MFAHSVLATRFLKLFSILVAITSSRYFDINSFVFDVVINMKNGIMVRNTMRRIPCIIPPNCEFNLFNIFVKMLSIKVAVDSVTVVGLVIKGINPLMCIITLKSFVGPCDSTFRRFIL